MIDRPDWIGQAPRDRDQAATSARPSWLPNTPHSVPESGGSDADPEPDTYAPGAILSTYDWLPAGICFRCGDKLRMVTPVAEVRGMEIVMCGSCVLREEEQRMRRAAEAGTPYVPGRIGRAPS